MNSKAEPSHGCAWRSLSPKYQLLREITGARRSDLPWIEANMPACFAADHTFDLVREPFTLAARKAYARLRQNREFAELLFHFGRSMSGLWTRTENTSIILVRDILSDAERTYRVQVQADVTP